MKLYVMRHGPAEDDSPTGRDADRPLTPQGRDRTRSVAKALIAEDEAPLSIVSSPLVRALQTAEIVAAAVELDRRAKDAGPGSGATGAVEVRREMAPGGDALALLAELVRTNRRRVMIVGHEPDLSMLVMRLVGQAPPQGMLKAMVVGVKLEPDAPDAAQGIGFVSKPRFVLDPKALSWERS